MMILTKDVLLSFWADIERNANARANNNKDTYGQILDRTSPDFEKYKGQDLFKN